VNVFIYEPVIISDSLIIHFFSVFHKVVHEMHIRWCLTLTDNTLHVRSQVLLE